MKVLSSGTRWVLGVVFAWGCLTNVARADAVLLMEDPINLPGKLTSVGHDAVWLDRLCTDDHISLRRCGAGEAGVVVSRYPGLKKGAAGQLDWLAMPVGPYLYAVDRAEDVPPAMTREGLVRLREQYWATHDGGFAGEAGSEARVALVGEAYRRRIVMARVHTTEAQDLQLMHWLNERPNVSHYTLFYPNCADFTGEVLGELFPKAFHRSYFFDAGMMTPRANLADLHRYAMRHPSVGWRVTVLPQVSGDIRRSGHLRGVTEAYLKSWWFLMPLDVLDPIELGTVTASGLLDHRYKGKEGDVAEPGLFFGDQAVASR